MLNLNETKLSREAFATEFQLNCYGVYSLYVCRRCTRIKLRPA